MIAEDYFFLPPDWQYQVEVARTWRTVVRTSVDRSEQRSSIKKYPAKRLNFTVVPFSAEENSYIRRKLYKGTGKIFGVPLWTDRCVTTQEVNPGSGTTFTVDDNSLRQFEVGAPIVLLQDINNYEITEIVSIGSNSFTIDSAFVLTWPSGTSIYPMVQGRFLASHSITEETTWGHGPLAIEILEEYDGDIIRSLFSGSSFNTYLNLPVFNLEPNRVSSPESMFEVFPEITTFLSKSLEYSYSDEGAIRTRFLFSFGTRTDAYELVKFFDECRGRLENFWYPSWTDDISLTSPFSSSDTVLDIEDIEWAAYWSDTKANGRYLYVLLPDGTEIIRKILSAPSDTQIEVDSSMGTTITSTAGVICCFLYMGRFFSDEIVLKYFTETYVDSSVGLTTIQDVRGTTTTT